MHCDKCGTEDRSVGPWKDPGPWKNLCGGCKIKIALTPERRAKIEAELRAVFRETVK